MSASIKNRAITYKTNYVIALNFEKEKIGKISFLI